MVPTSTVPPCPLLHVDPSTWSSRVFRACPLGRGQWSPIWQIAVCPGRLPAGRMLGHLRVDGLTWFVLPPVSCGSGTCVTSPTTPPCTRATAGRPSSTCPRWASPTMPTSWAGRCGPSSRRCWTSWSSQKRKSTTATNTESRRPPKTSSRWAPRGTSSLRSLARKTSRRPGSPSSSLSAEAPVDLKQRLGLLLFPCALGDTAATARRSTGGPRHPENLGQVARESWSAGAL